MALRGSVIGRKDTRILIQYRTSTKHAVTNEPVYAYLNLATVWSEEMGPVSSEKYEASQQVAGKTVRFKIRQSPTVAARLDEQCRIIRGSDTFDVSGIEPIGRNSEWIITAEKRDNG